MSDPHPLRKAWQTMITEIAMLRNEHKTPTLFEAMNDLEGEVRKVEAAAGGIAEPPPHQVVKLDANVIGDFFERISWPPGVPTPALDLVISEGTARLRVVSFLAAGGAPVRPDDLCSSFGKSPFEMIAAVGLLSEAWTLRHGGDPGKYPDGIKAQVVGRLDIQKAAAWLYSVQLAAALVTR